MPNAKRSVHNSKTIFLLKTFHCNLQRVTCLADSNHCPRASGTARQFFPYRGKLKRKNSSEMRSKRKVLTCKMQSGLSKTQRKLFFQRLFTAICKESLVLPIHINVLALQNLLDNFFLTVENSKEKIAPNCEQTKK